MCPADGSSGLCVRRHACRASRGESLCAGQLQLALHVLSRSMPCLPSSCSAATNTCCHAAAMLCVLLQEAAGTAMPPSCSAPVDDDVAAEQDRMRALLAQRIGEGGTAAAQLIQGMHKRQGTRRIRVPAAAAGNVSAARQCADSNVSATRRAWLSASVRGTAAAQLAAGFVGGAVLVVTE